MNQEAKEYYLRNPYVFAEEFLGLKLHWYQKLFLRFYAKTKNKKINA
jgi:hypothetical protein